MYDSPFEIIENKEKNIEKSICDEIRNNCNLTNSSWEWTEC